MQKVHFEEARSRPEFAAADEFLKNKIHTIAKSWENKANTQQEKLIAHGTMVAQIMALCLDVLTLYTESDVKSLGGKGGVYKLNKYLALRQLCEKQILGIKSGSWGLKQDFIEGDEFLSTVKLSQNKFLTKQELTEFINYVEIQSVENSSEGSEN